MKHQVAGVVLSLLLLAPGLAHAQVDPDAANTTPQVDPDAAPETASEPIPFDPVSFLSAPRLTRVFAAPDAAAIYVVQERPDWRADEMVETLFALGDDPAVLLPSRQPALSAAAADGEPADPEETSPPAAPKAMAWSPDADRVAMVLEGENGDPDQLYLFDPDAGALTPLTDHPTSVSTPHFGPDGAWIYFLALDALDAVEKARRARTHIVPPHYETRDHRHLWRVEVASGAVERLTGGAFSVRDLHVAASGAILIRRAPGREPDAEYASEVWVADSPDAAFVQLTDNDHPEIGARLSPDGSWVAYLARADLNGSAYVQRKLFLTRVATGETRLLTPAAPFEIDALRWRADGRAVIATANMGPRTGVLRIDAVTGDVVTLSERDHTVIDWTYVPESDAVVALFADATSPGDVWEIAAETAAARRLSQAGADAVAPFAFPEPRLARWTTSDGVEIEGLYLPPLNARPGAPAPLAVQIHGGPRLSDQFGGHWRVDRFAPVLAAQGYGVLWPNYRGGAGYGDAFMRGMHRTYFAHAHEDVLDGVDALIEEGVADPADLVVMGWSAGGHMTNKIITVTDRFQAAVSGAGAVDWAGHHLTSDVRGVRRLMFDADAWDPDALREVFWPQSLLSELHEIETPTLILGGEADTRVHPSQQLMLFHALRNLGVPTRLYQFPGAGHGLKKPSHKLFRINAAMDWFARHRGAPRHAWSAPPRDDAVARLLDAGAAALAEGGAGAFVFRGWDGPDLPVWFYVPEQAGPDSPIVIVAHGDRRDGDRHRDEWVPIADRDGLIIIAPTFSNEDAPGEGGYALGGVFDPATQEPRPERLWTFSALEPLFDEIVDALGSNRTGYTLYGHAAGAQFVHRALLHQPQARAERYLAANSDWYTMPDAAAPYPYGLQGAGVDDRSAAAALRGEMVVLVGDQDTDPNHATLRRTYEAMRQGRHRLERGQTFFTRAADEADRRGAPFGWRLEVVEGAGHANADMIEAAAAFIE